MCKLIPFCKGAVAVIGDDENNPPPIDQSNIWMNVYFLIIS